MANLKTNRYVNFVQNAINLVKNQMRSRNCGKKKNLHIKILQIFQKVYLEDLSDNERQRNRQC